MKLSLQQFRYALFAVPAVVVAGMLVAASPAGKTDASKPQSVATSPETLGVANALSYAFREVATSVLPAVVAIENRPETTWRSANNQAPMPGENPLQGTPFEDLFRGRGLMPNRPQLQGGIGSGVIIDPTGIILTNNHVVAGGGRVVVRTQDGREFEATQVLSDPQTDIAIVKVDTSESLPFAKLANSDLTQVGDWVVALGQPFGLESTVTAGIVSAKNRGIGITARESFIQTDAAINPGNSGGPLVNLQGEIVGINTAISSQSGANAGVGFAVPSNLAGWVKDQLLDNGRVQRAYLGVGIQPVSFELASQLGVPARSGVAITDVLPETPAAKTGFQAGDVIVKFDGKPVTSPQQLQLVVERSALGKRLPVEVIRNGKSMVLTYEPATAPESFGDNSSQVAPRDKSMQLNSLGLVVVPLNAEIASQLGIEDQTGVLISSVQANSLAAEAGLEPGMLIKQVNRQPVTSPEEFSRLVEADQDGSLLLLVRGEQGSRFVVLNR